MKPTASTPLRSKQGYDLLFASNCLGHVLLTELLLPLLRTALPVAVTAIEEQEQGEEGGFFKCAATLTACLLAPTWTREEVRSDLWRPGCCRGLVISARVIAARRSRSSSRWRKWKIDCLIICYLSLMLMLLLL